MVKSLYALLAGYVLKGANNRAIRVVIVITMGVCCWLTLEVISIKDSNYVTVEAYNCQNKIIEEKLVVIARDMKNDLQSWRDENNRQHEEIRDCLYQILSGGTVKLK